MENNLMKNEDTRLTLENLVDAKDYALSFVLDTMENKVKFYNALQNCDVLINDIKGSEINIKDIFIQHKTEVDGNGESKDVYLTIIFDDEGKTYVARAYGVYQSIKQLIMTFGNPAYWDKPLTVKVGTRKSSKSNHDMLILTAVLK